MVGHGPTGHPAITAADQLGLTPQALEQCDQALQTVALALDADGQQRLKALKNSWLELAQMLQQIPPTSTAIGMEDRLYTAECMRRYLPDTLSAFLSIPPTQRTPQTIELLYEQLEVLHQGILTRLNKAHQQATEALAQQHRFLKAKHQSGHS
jgi:hypothetical protein